MRDASKFVYGVKRPSHATKYYSIGDEIAQRISIIHSPTVLNYVIGEFWLSYLSSV
jgi:hypothetical protein